MRFDVFRVRFSAEQSCRSGLLAFVLVCVSLFAPAVVAQQLPVRLRLEPLSIRGRSGGPIPMQFKLEYNQPGMLEGDLFLEIYNSLQTPSDLMATIRYEGIVLQGQDYFFRTTLPPLRHSTTKQYLVVGWFETEAGRIPLTADPDRLDPPEPHELLTIGKLERATLICAVSGQADHLQPSPDMKYLSGALSLDHYNPATGRRDNDGSPSSPLPHERVQNYSAPWDALDFPEDPLALTCFDVVLLGDGALSRLQESQMKALLTWLDAGGSLCVFPNKDRLADPHLRFLRTVFTPPDSSVVGLSSRDDGRPLVIADVDDPILNVRYGLGRATLLPGNEGLSDQLTGASLGAVVAHLWKAPSTSPIRAGQVWSNLDLQEALQRRGLKLHQVDAGYMVLPRGSSPGDRSYNQIRTQNWMGQISGNYVFSTIDEVRAAFSIQTDLTPKQSFAVAACESALLPEGVEVVPTSIIAGLLLAYVLVIGPVDYFLLGFLRLRKFTWILFPVVTGAFTWLTLAIAGSYMAATETGGRLTLTDVVAGGRAVRETEIQMQFQGSQQTVTHDRTSSFVVPMSMARATIDHRTGTMTPAKIDVQLHYSGRFPQKYEATQHLSQWKPMLTRSLRLNPSATDVPDIPWDAPDLVSTAKGRRELVKLLEKLRTEDRQIDAAVFNQSQHYSMSVGTPFLFSRTVLQRAGEIAQQFRTQREWLMTGMNPRDYQGRLSNDELLTLAIMDTARGEGAKSFWDVVARVAPHGSATLEDLPLLDASNRNEWLLIVAVREGNQTHVFRRLYNLQPAISVESLTPETAERQAGSAHESRKSRSAIGRNDRGGRSFETAAVANVSKGQP